MFLKVQPNASPELIKFALEVEQALQRIATPVRPTKLWSVAKADLPLASDWTGCVLNVSDESLIAVSDGTNWLKPNGSVV